MVKLEIKTIEEYPIITFEKAGKNPPSIYYDGFLTEVTEKEMEWITNVRKEWDKVQTFLYKKYKNEQDKEDGESQLYNIVADLIINKELIEAGYEIPTNPKVDKAMMEAIWSRKIPTSTSLKFGPAGVSKSDVYYKLAAEGKVKIDTITIPVPEEWRSPTEREDEEREQEARDEFWKNHKEE